MKFLGPGFQNSEHKLDRQAHTNAHIQRERERDETNRITKAAFAGGKLVIVHFKQNLGNVHVR